MEYQLINKLRSQSQVLKTVLVTFFIVNIETIIDFAAGLWIGKSYLFPAWSQRASFSSKANIPKSLFDYAHLENVEDCMPQLKLIAGNVFH